MPKRSSTKPKERDANLTAFRVVQEATQDEPEDVAEPPPEKNPAAVALGRLGGKKGGKARADSLSPEKRREIARKAAQARWEKEKGES